MLEKPYGSGQLIITPLNNSSTIGTSGASKKGQVGTYTTAAVVEVWVWIVYSALGLKHRLALIHLGRTHIGQPGTAIGLGWRKDVVIPKAAVVWSVSKGSIGVSSHAGIATGHKDGHTLETQFEEFITLPLLVVGGEVILVDTIGDGDHIGRCIHTAHQGALVTIRVRISRIQDWIIAGLTIGRVCTIRPVQSVEKGVEDTKLGTISTISVVLVISLE